MPSAHQVREPAPLRLNQEQSLVYNETTALVARRPRPFVLVLGLRIAGTLDVPALEAALDAVVQRHAGLRSAIHPNAGVAGNARQIRLSMFNQTGIFLPGMYLQSPTAARPIVITRHEAPARSEDDILRALRGDVVDAFDFADPPAMRVRLLPLGDDAHLLILVVSHVVADAWSVRVLRRDLIRIYESHLTGKPCVLPDVPVHQPDFVRWEQRQLSSGAFAASLSYWKEVWSAFGNDHTRFDDLDLDPPATDATVSAVEEISLGADASREVRAISRQLGVTPYVLFRTCTCIALHHLTGRKRLVLNGNFANRAHPGVDGTIGWLSNRHLLAAELDPSRTGRSTLLAVRAGALEAFQHQATPLQAVWHRMGRLIEPARDQFSVTFDYVRDHVREAGNGIDHYPLASQAGQWTTVNMDIRVLDSDDDVRIHVIYAPDRFPHRTIVHILETIRRCTAALLGDPDVPISHYAGRPGRRAALCNAAWS